MPRVPVAQGPQVQQRGIPLVEQQRIATSAPNGLAALGQGIGAVGEAMAREQQRADELRVEEAFNQLRERQLDLTLGQQTGYTNVKGRNALPANGEPLSQRYMTQFKGVSDELAAGLGNDRQKELFGRYATRAGLEFRGGLMRHEDQELDNWRKQTVDGVFAVESDNAAKNWNNPEAINLSRSRIDLNLANMRDADGLPADQVEKIRIGALGKLHAGVLDAAIQNRNIGYAQQYLKTYGNEMDAGTLLKATGIIQKEADAQYGLGIANKVMSEVAPKLNPDDFTRLTTLVMGQESRGNQAAVSPKGATGVMQVMPATGPEAAKLAGLEWDEQKFKNDANYNKALGDAYLAKQLQTNGGDVAKALAAYNAGPGALAEAVKKAEKDGKPAQWLAYLPKETQEYVPAILSKFQTGAGQPVKPTLAEIDERLKTDPYLAARPDALKIAREQVKQQFELQDKAIKQRQEESEGELYRQIVANGGDFYATPPSLRAQLNPTKIDAALKFASTIQAGQEPITNPALYQRLATDPNYLRTLTDSQFYALHGDLSRSDFKHFSNERAKAQGKTVGQAEDLNSEALNSVLNQRLQSLGINPRPAAKETAENARVGAMRQFITRSVLDSQAQQGKKFSDAEVVKHIDEMFARSATFRSSFLGITTGKETVALLTMKPSDVPSDARDKIKAAFKSGGQPEPTDADILQVYWAQRFSAPNSALSQAKAPAQKMPEVPR